MKQKVKYMLLMLMLLPLTQSQAQNNNPTELEDFKIIIENTDKGVAMKSYDGSAWIDLSFSLKNDFPQAVDEYGMTKLGKVSDNKDADLADFLFTITKTDEGFELKGIEGTAWTAISFTLDENGGQAIDQFGTRRLN
ncbi:MAG: hypothetical protein AAFX87_31670 [Bacteroidota bacterium]